jgi:hypothetical protein
MVAPYKEESTEGDWQIKEDKYLRIKEHDLFSPNFSGLGTYDWRSFDIKQQDGWIFLPAIIAIGTC